MILAYFIKNDLFEAGHFYLYHLRNETATLVHLFILLTFVTNF
jgi:hypothetical protein